MIQRPYFLYYLSIEKGTQDEKGNFLAVKTKWKYFSNCRDESNTKDSIIQLANGVSYNPVATIYTDIKKDIPKVNTQIIVATKKIDDMDMLTEKYIVEGLESGLIRLYEKIKSVSISQHNVRIFV